jgi:hypothetical protein
MKTTQKMKSGRFHIFLFGISLIGCATSLGYRVPANADSNNTIRDKNVKIAIVGGGVSGLSSALWLVEKGYHNITIFEKESDLGGKVQSYTSSDGSVHEVGAIVQSDDFQNIYEMARVTGYATDKADWLTPFPRETNVINKTGKKISSFLGYLAPLDPSRSMTERFSRVDELFVIPAMLTLKSHSGPYRDLYSPGFDSLVNRATTDANFKKAYLNLLEPTDKFMSSVDLVDWSGSRDLRSALGPFSLFFNMTGYGFTSEVPALYHMKFFSMVANVGEGQALGLFPMTTATRGYQALFRHIGDYLRQNSVNIQLGVEVENVARPSNSKWGTTLANSDQIQVRYKRSDAVQTEPFDVLIVATPPDAAQKYLSLEPGSKQFFSRVKYYNFVTTIFEDRNNSLKKYINSTAFIEDYALNAGETIKNSHVVGFYNNDGSNVFTAYSFTVTPDVKWINDSEVQDQLVKDFSAIGATISKDSILVTKQWRNYFPHFSSEVLKSNPDGLTDDGTFIPRMLGLQGQQNTLFLMATFDFESTEHLAGYSRQMVDRFFQ